MGVILSTFIQYITTDIGMIIDAIDRPSIFPTITKAIPMLANVAFKIMIKTI